MEDQICNVLLIMYMLSINNILIIYVSIYCIIYMKQLKKIGNDKGE